MVIQYKVRDLLWRRAGRLVRFVAVIHPTRGSCLLMSTDTSLAAIEIHSPLRPALQNRAYVQAGGAADRLVQLPLLDVRHEAAAPPQRQPAPPSCVAGAPRRRQAQAARLPRLHPGGCGLAQGCFSNWPSPSRSASGPPSVPGCAPSGPESHPRSWSWPTQCARACRNFS